MDCSFNPGLLVASVSCFRALSDFAEVALSRIDLDEAALGVDEEAAPNSKSSAPGELNLAASVGTSDALESPLPSAGSLTVFSRTVSASEDFREASPDDGDELDAGEGANGVGGGVSSGAGNG